MIQRPRHRALRDGGAEHGDIEPGLGPRRNAATRVGRKYSKKKTMVDDLLQVRHWRPSFGLGLILLAATGGIASYFTRTFDEHDTAAAHSERFVAVERFATTRTFASRLGTRSCPAPTFTVRFSWTPPRRTSTTQSSWST